MAATERVRRSRHPLDWSREEELLLGPRALAIVTSPPEGLDHLLRSGTEASDLDAVAAVYEAARIQHDQANPIARELLGIARAGLVRSPHTDLRLMASTLVLHTALAREVGDSSGVLSARMVDRLARRLREEDPEVDLQFHSSLDAAIILSESGRFETAEAILRARETDLASRANPHEAWRRWHMPLPISLAGRILLRGRATGSDATMRLAERVAKTGLESAADFGEAEWILAGCERLANIAIVRGQFARKENREKRIREADGWLQEGQGLSTQVGTSWQLQWAIARARLALLRRDKDAFSDATKSATEVLERDPRFPRHGRDLRRLIDAGRRIGVDPIPVPPADESTGWTADYRPSPRAFFLRSRIDQSTA
jgi:hypothetical protein